jgi:hypothetical protein
MRLVLWLAFLVGCGAEVVVATNDPAPEPTTTLFLEPEPEPEPECLFAKGLCAIEFPHPCNEFYDYDECLDLLPSVERSCCAVDIECVETDIVKVVCF